MKLSNKKTNDWNQNSKNKNRPARLNGNKYQSKDQQLDLSQETSPPKKKRTRPWRQVVRHRAKRERLAQEAEERGESQQPSSDVPKSTSPSDLGPASKQNKSEPQTRLDSSYFRYLNEQLYTLTSREAAKLFEEDPEAFNAYHSGYKQQVKKWLVHPLDKIMKDLSTLPSGSVIADIGCGEAKIAAQLGDRYKTYSFDLVALNSRVTIADMANLPLKRSSVDVCVYCLSLMGRNLAEFLREAHRILKQGGRLKIVEVTSRFRAVNQFVTALEKMGFALKRKKSLDKDYFLFMTFVKNGPIKNRRPLGLKLYPCLYKKR